MIRSLVAIPLPFEVVDGLVAAICSFQELGLEGCGVKAAALHLTLMSPGNVHEKLLKLVGPVLHRVASHTCPFELILHGADAFPQRLHDIEFWSFFSLESRVGHGEPKTELG